MNPAYDTIFLDRDGTLNPDPGYIASMKDFNFFPNSMVALKRFLSITKRFCIVTNQSGVGRGMITLDALREIHDFISMEFRKNNLPLLGIYLCPDHPDRASNRRKPGVEMFHEAARDHGIDLKKCLMIGDSADDMEAGMRLNMDTMLVLTGRGREAQSVLGKITPTFIANDLLDGARQLVEAA